MPHACGGEIDRLELLLPQGKKGCLLVSCEGLQVVEVMTEEQCNFVGCAVATTDPNDLRWRPKEKAPLVKIGILRHDGQPVLNSIIPNDLVVCCM